MIMPDSDRDPLAAARGIILGSLASGIIWAIIIWAVTR